MGADEEERWGLAHYHTLTVLFAAYAVGMYAKGAMSLGIFGMSKVGKTLRHAHTHVQDECGGQNQTAIEQTRERRGRAAHHSLPAKGLGR